ncbi:hypothetical protein D3C75_1239610 [compost metagenome]
MSINAQKNPSPRHSHEAIETTKRNSACHRLMALPSAFCTRRPHTCIPRVCPPWVQNLAKKPNSANSRIVDSSGSPSSAPASVSSRMRASPMIAIWIIL